MLATTAAADASRHAQALKKHGTFVRGEVVKLTDTSATLADGQTLEFDYAAICSGTDYAVGKSASAVTLAQRKEELQVRRVVASCYGPPLADC